MAKAKVFPHLEAWVRVGHGLSYAKAFVSLSSLSYSKEMIKKKEAHTLHDNLMYISTEIESQKSRIFSLI
jgi:ribosomal protein L7/L12